MHVHGGFDRSKNARPLNYNTNDACIPSSLWYRNKMWQPQGQCRRPMDTNTRRDMANMSFKPEQTPCSCWIACFIARADISPLGAGGKAAHTARTSAHQRCQVTPPPAWQAAHQTGWSTAAVADQPADALRDGRCPSLVVSSILRMLPGRGCGCDSNPTNTLRYKHGPAACCRALVLHPRVWVAVVLVSCVLADCWVLLATATQVDVLHLNTTASHKQRVKLTARKAAYCAVVWAIAQQWFPLPSKSTSIVSRHKHVASIRHVSCTAAAWCFAERKL